MICKLAKNYSNKNFKAACKTAIWVFLVFPPLLLKLRQSGILFPETKWASNRPTHCATRGGIMIKTRGSSEGSDTVFLPHIFSLAQFGKRQNALRHSVFNLRCENIISFIIYQGLTPPSIIWSGGITFWQICRGSVTSYDQNELWGLGKRQSEGVRYKYNIAKTLNHFACI